MLKLRSSALSLALLLTASALHAAPPAGGDYVIVRSTLDAGGGISAGGNYVLTGTIAQPEANAQPAIGSMYALAGGFWGRAVLGLIFKDGFE